MSETKKKTLTDWDWTTLVAAWRYYEHRHTITSYMFPHDIVLRFFCGAYDVESCKRIARQFVEIDHRKGPDDEIDGWVGDDIYCSSDRRAWRLFYFYLSAWNCGFTKARVTRGKIRHVEVFRADCQVYDKEDYERFGVDGCHYRDCEIEFD